ncbi:phenylpyruvate tautomerase MIF-related protein [Desulfohalovibrio reitneri]|uniref:phenylpyruvate tautomerase MIF-related protein n=1 Tax=Desulfohalovibrio reitneri TaxID=1307759 RepID=UPI00068F529F|nr:phenylpyruvate tautomerase MIF-related protein [Desulfohalovibrio reitneri]
MPIVLVETTFPMDRTAREDFALGLSSRCAEWLGKPESSVMVRVRCEDSMSFGGSMEPCAFVEFKSVGLAEEDCPELSAKLCDFVGEACETSRDRIYVEFKDLRRGYVGARGTTLAG